MYNTIGDGDDSHMTTLDFVIVIVIKSWRKVSQLIYIYI